MTGAVLVVSPGGTTSTGGICRMVRDAELAWGALPGGAPPMRVLDSGGMDGKLRMPARFALALARTLFACATGGAALVHIHVAARGSVARKAAFVGAARLCGVPAILHMHGADFAPFFAGLPAPGRWAVRRLFAAASGVVVLGDRGAAFARDALRVPADRLHVLPNAVPAAAAGPDRPTGAVPHLVFLGALTERKGVDTLLAALADAALAARPWRLTLAGNGDAARWRDEAARLGLAGRVAFPGWLDGAAARALLGTADALVLPARQEAMPMVILEAMAAAVPVVATAVGEIGALVTDHETGLLLPPADPAALAAALARLLDDPAHARRLGDAGARRHRAAHDLAGYAPRLHAIYARVRRARPIRTTLAEEAVAS